MNLQEFLVHARDHKGTVWTLEESEDLNANLVRFPSGDGVGEHVNDEVDVVMVGVDGFGAVSVEGREHHLSAGRLVFIPKCARRSVKSHSDEFAYLSIHRTRGPLRLGNFRETEGEA
ncbi:hypothetical protein BH23ACT11_BH23ACT11_04670 [soil metagenome]